MKNRLYGNNKQLQELTKTFLDDFAALSGEKDAHYALGYLLPITLSEVFPHDDDLEFMSPYIGMGFMKNMIEAFFEKYIQKIPSKIQDIINKYPKDYRDERFRLQDWNTSTIEVMGTDSEVVDGKWTFLGFKPFPAKEVRFTYVAVNSGWKADVICQYYNENYELSQDKIEEIHIKKNNEHVITLKVDLDGEVTAEQIHGYKHVATINGVLNAINFIHSDLINES